MIIELAKKAKESSLLLLSQSEEHRNMAIVNIANLLRKNTQKILNENTKDLEQATLNNLDPAIIDRLKLTSERIENMALACEEIARSKQVVGNTISSFQRDDGLIIEKQRVPIGVILMIFESRPNVIIDSSALAIKSGNAIILKGGKEASNSNKILGEIVSNAIKDKLPDHCIQVLSSTNRDNISLLLEQKKFIDVVIPRGGENLINYIYEHSKIPVIAHFKGVCHLFIDEFADHEMAIDIAINAKTQRPGVCNAIETLLIHQNMDKNFLLTLISKFKKQKTKLLVDPKLVEILYDNTLEIASKEDYGREFLANILVIKLVANLDEAISHIQKYGSNHTEAIITNHHQNAIKFINSIDASCIMHNASTRFNDGGELGLGAELGIATTKLHAYGPMGAGEMTTTRFIVKGSGHIRS